MLAQRPLKHIAEYPLLFSFYTKGNILVMLLFNNAITNPYHVTSDPLALLLLIELASETGGVEIYCSIMTHIKAYYLR